MNTTQLIELLKKNEFGASGRPREISLGINPKDIYLSDVDEDADDEEVSLMFYDNHEIKVTGGGDGFAGAQLDLTIIRCRD